MSKNTKTINPRLGTVGGQAVIEGVMMKSKSRYSVACRREDGSIRLTNDTFVPARSKYKILGIPVLRGVVNFVEMMILSYKTLTISADAMGIDELEPENKFEKWCDEHFGEHIVSIIMGIATVLGMALGIGLFFFLPILATKGLDALCGGKLGWGKNLVEGVIKIAIFVGYLALTSLIPDIRRTFEYHGAEHKSIFCYEAGDELTPENVKKYRRFHPRCGTSFLFVMLIISILIFSLPFVTWDSMLLRMLTKLVMLPLVVGIGYEFIMYAGKHENPLVKILSAPGLWMQRITTREPDETQIECAITALKSALPDVFPEFPAEFEAKYGKSEQKSGASPENTDVKGESADAKPESADIKGETIASAPKNADA